MVTYTKRTGFGREEVESSDVKITGVDISGQTGTGSSSGTVPTSSTQMAEQNKLLGEILDQLMLNNRLLEEIGR